MFRAEAVPVLAQPGKSRNEKGAERMRKRKKKNPFPHTKECFESETVSDIPPRFQVRKDVQ